MWRISITDIHKIEPEEAPAVGAAVSRQPARSLATRVTVDVLEWKKTWCVLDAILDTVIVPMITPSGIADHMAGERARRATRAHSPSMT